MVVGLGLALHNCGKFLLKFDVFDDKNCTKCLKSCSCLGNAASRTIWSLGSLGMSQHFALKFTEHGRRAESFLHYFGCFLDSMARLWHCGLSFPRLEYFDTMLCLVCVFVHSLMIILG